MVDTVYGFLYDPIFDRVSDPLRSSVSTGGLCLLSNQSLSYFNEAYLITDNRPIRTPVPLNLASTTRSQLIIDKTTNVDFLAILSLVTPEQRNSLFAIIDQIFFSYSQGQTDTTRDQILTSDQAYNIYTPNSIKTGSGLITSNANTTPSVTPVTAPVWAEFSVDLVTGTTNYNVDFKIWVSNNVFYTEYPTTTITAVVPPMPVATLLTAPLTGTSANSLVIASQAAVLSQSTLAQKIKDGDNSGYVTYTARFYDTAGNILQVPFNILYKGRAPDYMAMRMAIKELILTDPLLNELWRRRVPELFVDGQFYLIPQWNNTTTRPDQVIYTGIVGHSLLVNNTRKVLPQFGTDYVSAYMEISTAAYSQMMFTSVPHNLNLQTLMSLRTIHPSYQSVPTTSPNFQYMDTTTQEFAIALNTALVIAAGLSTPTSQFQTLSIYDGTYVVFDVNRVEYCVMTKESYNNLMG